MRSYNKASADVSVQDTEVTLDSKSDWLDEKCCTLTNRCCTISQFLLASGKEYFVAAAWRLWQTLITGALPSWIQTSDYRNSPPKKEKKKETPAWSVFQPYVKHRHPAVVPRGERLFSFSNVTEGAMLVKSIPCQFGNGSWTWLSVGVRCGCATSILVPWEDMWPSNQQEEKTGGGSFFLFFFSTCTSIIWGRMEAMLPCDPATGGSRRRTLSSPVVIDTSALTLSSGNSRRPFAVKNGEMTFWRKDEIEL